MERKHLLLQILRRGEELGLLFSFLLLILVEAGYVAWLQRLPAIPTQAHSDPFLLLPPWYEHPRAEVTLLLTLVGGMIGWAGAGLAQFLKTSRRHNGIAEKSGSKAVAAYRLKTAAFYALLAGADLLSIQFLRY
ncbi:MAG: hypothetical protein ACRD7E_18370 [Bryobacteraceae bacterium]